MYIHYPSLPEEQPGQNIRPETLHKWTAASRYPELLEAVRAVWTKKEGGDTTSTAAPKWLANGPAQSIWVMFWMFTR